jgi:hypothetical protein
VERLAGTARWEPRWLQSAKSGERRGTVGSACLVGLLGALLLAVLGALIRHEPVPRGDDLIYERMAIHPFAVHTFPFGYRIGLPWLVHVLPLGSTAGFLLLAWLAAGGAAAFAYLLMRELGGSPRVAATLSLLMCISPPFLLVVIRQGRNPDIATVFFMMAATYFVVRREHWKLALTLLIGVTFREAVLFIVPLAYAVWATKLLDWRAAAQTLAVGLPAAGAYLALKVGITTVGESQVPGYGGSLVGERFHVIKTGLTTPFREARRMATIYGPLWLVSPLALRDMRFARRGLVLVALSLCAMTFALDWGRMILLAAPVFYPAAAFVLSRRGRWFLPTVVAMLALAIGYAVYMDVSGVQSGIIGNGAPPYPVQ